MHPCQHLIQYLEREKTANDQIIQCETLDSFSWHKKSSTNHPMWDNARIKHPSEALSSVVIFDRMHDDIYFYRIIFAIFATTQSATCKTSQCQGWDFQKLSRRPQLSCRGSSVVSFKNPDKSFPCISPFQCHGHGHGHASQCQGWNLNFQKLSGSCPGLSLNNLQTNHFRKTKDKEFCDSGITFRWIPLELLCLTSFHLLLLS